MLSGKARGRISARTEEAVRAAATELGYRPNVAARALRTGVARSVALVVPDITNPFFGRVLRGAQRAAQGAGYTVVLVDIGNDRAWEAASLKTLLAGPADGLLLFEADLPPGASEHAIQIEMRPGGLPVVRLDVEAGIDAALDHLQELGHERIGHVSSSIGAPTFERRRERIIARLGVDPPTATRSSRSSAAAEAAGPLLEQDVTAVVCDDDILAGGVYLAARERGIAIPGDLSVVGFDDLDFARVLAPPLTTVAADAEGLGAAAFEALARDLAGDPPPAEHVLPVSCRARVHRRAEGQAPKRHRRGGHRRVHGPGPKCGVSLDKRVIRIMLIRMTRTIRTRGAQFVGVVLALFAGSAVAAAVAQTDERKPRGRARGRRQGGQDPQVLARARAATDRTGAQLRVAHTTADQLGVTHYFAARGYDTIVTVGVDRRIAIAPVADHYPGVRFVAADSNQLDHALSR